MARIRLGRYTTPAESFLTDRPDTSPDQSTEPRELQPADLPPRTALEFEACEDVPAFLVPLGPGVW